MWLTVFYQGYSHWIQYLQTKRQLDIYTLGWHQSILLTPTFKHPTNELLACWSSSECISVVICQNKPGVLLSLNISFQEISLETFNGRQGRLLSSCAELPSQFEQLQKTSNIQNIGHLSKKKKSFPFFGLFWFNYYGLLQKIMMISS